MSLENDSLTKIEREIDAALKRLSEAQPPAAMTSRIQRSLETAAAKSQQTRSGRLFWVPATCAAMAVVLLVVLLHPDLTRRNHASTVETAKMVTADSAPPKLAKSLPTLVSAEDPRERKLPTTYVHPRSHRQRRGEYRHAVNLFNYPLTRQEKLLLQFAQNAKPEDLQALNPEYQAKVEAQQDAEFAAYLKSGGISSIKETAN